MMKYQSMKDAPWHRKPHPPLRTVAEIAEILGIPYQRLQRALMREGAPQRMFRGNDVSHTSNPNRVWYEPRAVIRWYKDVIIPEDLAHPDRAYRREYYAEHYKAGKTE